MFVPREDVVETLHGVQVADPYRWLEDLDSAATAAFVEEQNVETNAWLAEVDERARIHDRLTALWNYPRYSVPVRRADKTFYRKNDGLQNQAVLYVRNGTDRVLIDPNTLSEDGTVALQGTAISEDGTLVAYSLARSGSDWQEIRLREVDGADRGDLVQWTKFTNVAWRHDGAGFYYSRFPDPATVPAGRESYDAKLYWHALGDDQAADALVFERPDAPELNFDPAITDDGQYLVLHVWNGTDPKNRLYYREVASRGDFVRLFDAADASYGLIESVGRTFYIQTDKDAPRRRIVAVDLDNPGEWRDVVPEQEDVIESSALIAGRLVVVYLHDAQHRIALFDLDGTPAGEIPLPAIGSVGGISGRTFDRSMFFAFTSYLYPTTIFEYDFDSGTLTTVTPPAIAVDAEAYRTDQVFVTSKDGTRVPMFITRRRDLAPGAPTILYGYGGFEISLTPGFSPGVLAWLEMGGVYAVANLRGGGEYGEAWHLAGTLERKQNVFGDFIACAEHLIDSGITTRDRLAIEGGSNGGLLVAAVMLQRPDLFGAVVCHVPVADMLRYHRWTVGRYWTGEYGDADADGDQLRYLLAYSPVHNARSANYPATLITTADHDDRVAPCNAFKFAAALQYAQEGEAPILLRVETKAGHGAGKPTSKLIDELADVYSFLFRTLHMEKPASPSL